MKHRRFSPDQKQKSAIVSPATAAAVATPSEVDYTPAVDEVARRAYFNYVNQGSLPGHDVQHWLDAEAQLLAERKLTRAHGFHKRT